MSNETCSNGLGEDIALQQALNSREVLENKLVARIKLYSGLAVHAVRL